MMAAAVKNQAGAGGMGLVVVEKPEARLLDGLTTPENSQIAPVFRGGFSEGIDPVNFEGLPIMLGIKEAASAFGLPESLVRRLALSGAIAAVRSGAKKIYINRASLEAYLSGSHV